MFGRVTHLRFELDAALILRFADVRKRREKMEYVDAYDYE